MHLTDISNSITIRIGLVCIRCCRTIITYITYTISISKILLARVSIVRTVIIWINDTIVIWIWMSYTPSIIFMIDVISELNAKT